MKLTRGRRAGADIFLRYLKPSERTGWRASLDALLSRLGPGWRVSPLPRLVQVLCLALFLYGFFYVCWPYARHFDETVIAAKEWFPVELFLLIDPLVGLSTVLAGKFVNITLWWTVGVLVFCIIFPRAFCGSICPLGTLIDLFDWLVGRRVQRFHLRQVGWLAHLKYYLLTGVLVSSVFGLLLAGFVAAIPIVTRFLLFTGGRLQLRVLKDANHLHPVDGAFFLSLTLFASVFLLSFLGRRFWCRHVCPSGALFSVFNSWRLLERKVESSCIECNRCVEICPFDAIREDFTTRTSDCTFCQTCGGVCPSHSIKFVERWNTVDLRQENDTVRAPRPLSRRGFMLASLAGMAAATPPALRSEQSVSMSGLPLRPPGSVPEKEFLDLCIRCGECFKVCPGPVLRAAGFEHGFESLWTPVAVPSHAGCHQDCNFCTRVCPTGAIQPLSMEVKRATHMGLARINTETCLPFRDEGREDCDLCFEECRQAGYHAIELQRHEIELDPPPPAGLFSEEELDAMRHINVPVIDPDACVGCGICEYRCHTRFVLQEQRFEESAIVVSAANEHRLLAYPEKPDELPEPNTPR